MGMGALAALLAAGPATAAVNSGKVSFSLGTDVTTAYFFRGILQERNGLIAQPYGEVSYSLYENEGAPLSSVSLTGGLWASVHSEKTGASGTGAPALYELDVYGGGSVGLFDTVELGASYIVYLSPNNAFSKIQEVAFSLALDDSAWMGPLALNPSGTIAMEVEGTAFGRHRGTVGEVGIEPAFEILPFDRYPVTLSLPVLVSFSVEDYYEDARGDDDGWGYARFGAFLSVPLAFIPEDFGSWSATGGAHIYTFNSNLQIANGDDDPWVVGTWGVNMTY